MTSTDIAPSASNRATRPPLSPKRQRISPKLRQAIDVLTGNSRITLKTAAAQAGLSPEHLSRCLAMPHVQSFARERMRQDIFTAAMRGAVRLGELVDAKSESVSLDAAKHALAIEGIKPPENAGVNVNVNVTPGYVINLSKRGDGPTSPCVDVTHSAKLPPTEPE